MVSMDRAKAQDAYFTPIEGHRSEKSTSTYCSSNIISNEAIMGDRPLVHLGVMLF